jgi:hypothetical protein
MGLATFAQPGVKAESAGTTNEQEEDAAEDRHILIEI